MRSRNSVITSRIAIQALALLATAAVSAAISSAALAGPLKPPPLHKNFKPPKLVYHDHQFRPPKLVVTHHEFRPPRLDGGSNSNPCYPHFCGLKR